MLVDSHVNLHTEKYTDDLGEVMNRAEEAGVSCMLTISDRLDSTEEILAVVERYPHLWRSVGVHPHHASDYKDLGADQLIEMAAHPRVIGIGECGLDFHYEYSDRDVQEKVFREHIKAARATGLPLIIHSRNADDAMAKMLTDAYKEGPFVPLLHCYTGGKELADAALAMGGYVAFSGIITFKNAEDVRSVASHVPLERIILETDCPYLAPVPWRGRRNEPSYLPHVADKMAEIKGVSRDVIDETTTDAFFNLFTKAERPE